MTIVIFGGGGDLTHRKLLPALYNLHVDGLLPPQMAIVGVGRKPMTDEAYRDFAKDGVTRFSRRPIDEAAWQTFAAFVFFAAAEIDAEQGLASLGARLDIIEHEHHLVGDRIYYMALPPSLFGPTVKQLDRARLVNRSGSQSARIIVEKPIGRDIESACAINDAIAKVFDEPQIYRIDHYLGKETVQNILVLRFANSIFEPLFNQKYVDTCRLRWRRKKASAHAPATTSRPGRCATWCRTTCCSCSRWWRWSRRIPSTRTSSATRSSRC